MSRRHAEEAISAGRVQVNGEVVTELGSKVDPARDRVALDGQRVGAPEPPATIMLFKPDNVMTTLDDPRERATVAELVKDEPYRFVPVGRLDYHTEGLLLMSTDGDLIHRLLHPRYHVPKAYRVRVKGKVSDAALDRLRDGVELDDGPTRPSIAEILDVDDRTTWLEIIVTEGRNHLVRRMCEAVGHEVRRIVRTEFGTLFVGDLKPGQYRYLSPDELRAVYRSADLSPQGGPPRFDEVGVAVMGASRRHKGPIPGVHEPKDGSAGRRRIAEKGRAKPRAAPVDDEELAELRPRFQPKIADPRPDGVPENRKAGYPDTRVWRSDRTRARPAEDVEADERIVRVRAERKDRRPGADEGRGGGDRDARPRRPRSGAEGPRGRRDAGDRGFDRDRRPTGRWGGPRRGRDERPERDDRWGRDRRDRDPRGERDPRPSRDRRDDREGRGVRRVEDDGRSFGRRDGPPRSRSTPRGRSGAPRGRDGGRPRRGGAGPRGRSPGPRRGGGPSGRSGNPRRR